jgi:hypothetical protein
MVLKFRLISNEQDDFIRDFEILDDQTFFDFHLAVQENLHFDKSQIASFFVCNEKWEKEQEVTLFELTDEENASILVMDNTHLVDHVSKAGDKLLYVFDVFNERLFFIELVEKTMPDPSASYPKCINERGKAPQQILMDPIFFSTREADGNQEFDDTFFGDELMDPDDLDDMRYQSFDDSNPDEE